MTVKHFLDSAQARASHRNAEAERIYDAAKRYAEYEIASGSSLRSDRDALTKGYMAGYIDATTAAAERLRATLKGTPT